LPNNNTVSSLGNVDCVLEYLGQEQTAIEVARERYRAITNAALLVDDRLGTYTVRQVETLMGVTVAVVT